MMGYVWRPQLLDARGRRIASGRAPATRGRSIQVVALVLVVCGRHHDCWRDGTSADLRFVPPCCAGPLVVRRTRARHLISRGGGSASDGGGASGDDERRNGEGELERPWAWLRDLSRTYEKLWTGEQVTPEDVARDIDLTALSALSTGVFNAYVAAAPAAQPPDCTGYSASGACCPSLACYRELPFGAKVFVTGALLIAARNCLRILSNPSLSSSNSRLGKVLFIAAVCVQLLYTLYGP